MKNVALNCLSILSNPLLSLTEQGAGYILYLYTPCMLRRQGARLPFGSLSFF